MFLLLTGQATLRQGQLTKLRDAHISGGIIYLSWGQNWNLFSFSNNCTFNAVFTEEMNLRSFILFLIWKHGMTTSRNTLQGSLQFRQLNCYSKNWSLSSDSHAVTSEQIIITLLTTRWGGSTAWAVPRPFRETDRGNSWLYGSGSTTWL